MSNNERVDNEYIFTSPKYINTMIEYTGQLKNTYSKDYEIVITIISDKYAIVSIKAEMIDAYKEISEEYDIVFFRKIINDYTDEENFKVVYVVKPQIYTLEGISALEAAQVNLLEANVPLDLNGEGVVVAIIDTGIDYLNDEFKDLDGKTRIISIWDQTIPSELNESKLVPFGKVYNSDLINEAIQSYKLGENPYEIVPSRDYNGHGTAMAGIVGATGVNKDIKGVAPKCEYVVVKIAEAEYIKRKLETDKPVYSLYNIIAALEYIKTLLYENGKPIVILLPLGSNNGNHKGRSIFDNYISNISSNVGVVIVTSTGNEGDKDGHVSGIIEERNDVEVIDLMVAEGQKYIEAEIWIDLPNIVEVNLISPSGEETGFIQAISGANKLNKFIFEETETSITYSLPDVYSGEELIAITMSNIVAGVWQIKLKLRSGEMARYNAWLWQSGLLKPKTRFSPSDQFGTITVPSDSEFVITVAAYNQNNNSLLAYSGVAFRNEDISTIDFAAGGVDTLTVGLNNTTQVINGTSLAAAVGAGACVVLFQWGIVNKNYPYLYSQSIATFLRRGVIRRGNDIHPNPEWGYGTLNFYKIFENMI